MGITFTRKGYIQVVKDGVVLSSHIQEREAIESLSEREDGDYVLRYPDVAVTVILRKSDTTPPAVPSGFSASAATATSVTLTLTANVESDFSNYVLERSSDNIGWGYLKSFSGTSTTDTVDVNNSVYYYRAFAIDTRGNRSAYTSVKSAGPYTAEFGWLANVFPVSIPRGSSIALDSYINDPAGQLVSITSVGDPLPAGVTIESNPWRLSASASASAGTSSGHQLALNDGANTLTTLTVSSGPWTVGHAFAQGDVPSGSYVRTTSSQTQSKVRNYWPDGSVKFAVLSGVSGGVLDVYASSSEATGSNIAEPTASWYSSNVSVTLTGSGAGTYTPSTARTNGQIAWSRTTAHKVRESLGHVMSEFHYYTPTSDGHLGIWWYVRAYSDRTEVETAIEQGWIKVASVANKTYTATVTIGGTLRATHTNLSHRHHTRWSRRDWVGTDPQTTVQHNIAYLKSTKLVPNYATITVSSTLLNGYTQSAAPMTQGDYPSDGSGTGAHPFLGLLSEWEAACVISGDSRAYNGVLANEQAVNCMWYGGAGGSLWGFGLVCRDENTGLPIDTNAYVNESFSGGSGAGGLVVGTTTGKVWSTDSAHSGNGGYLAYLLTGRWFSLETVQFNHGVNHLSVSGGSINRMVNVGTGDRTHAWLFRTMGCALSVTPDNHPLRSGLITYAQSNINAWRTGQVGFNNLGIRRTTLDGYADRLPYWNARNFMQDFISQAFPFVFHVCGSALSGASETQLREIAEFHASYAVGKLGTDSTFKFQDAALYDILVGPTAPVSQGQQGTFSVDFASLYSLNVSQGLIPSSAPTGLRGGNFPDATSYWGNFHPTIAYAVDLGVSGASAAYARMTTASNYQTLYADFQNAPQWAVVPR